MEQGTLDAYLIGLITSAINCERVPSFWEHKIEKFGYNGLSVLEKLQLNDAYIKCYTMIVERLIDKENDYRNFITKEN